MSERILDARGLEPPEPMELTLDAVDTLAPGERLRLLIHRAPYMLYPILNEWGFDCRTQSTEDGTFEVLIWRKEQSAAGSGASELQ
jgi:TusA-related sulfurtransferase